MFGDTAAIIKYCFPGEGRLYMWIVLMVSEYWDGQKPRHFSTTPYAFGVDFTPMAAIFILFQLLYSKVAQFFDKMVSYHRNNIVFKYICMLIHIYRIWCVIVKLGGHLGFLAAILWKRQKWTGCWSTYWLLGRMEASYQIWCFCLIVNDLPFLDPTIDIMCSSLILYGILLQR